MSNQPAVIIFDAKTSKHALSAMKTALKSFSSLIELKAGETLAEVGSMPTSCFLLENGIIIGNVPMPKGNTRLGLTTIHRRGSLLFYENNTLKQPLNFNFKALTDCKLISVDYDELNTVADTNSKVQGFLLSSLSKNALTAMKKADKPNANEFERDYCTLLLLLAEECGESTPEGTVIHSPINQTAMADLLNVTRTTLHYTCQKLQEQGIIVQKKMEIIVPSIDALIQYRDEL